MNKPDAVLIDLDNTIYLYDPVHEIALKKTLEKFSNEFGITYNDCLENFNLAKKIVKELNHNLGASHSRLLYFQKMFEILGLGSKVFFALDLEQTYWFYFFKEMELLPCVEEFFNHLRVNGIPTVIITDLTSQIQMKKIIFFNLEDKIDFLITSEEAGGEKVTGKPYNLALKKLGLDEKANIWMIGDNIEADIISAKRVIKNIITFVINNSSDEASYKASNFNFIINKLNESLTTNFK